MLPQQFSLNVKGCFPDKGKVPHVPATLSSRVESRSRFELRQELYVFLQAVLSIALFMALLLPVSAGAAPVIPVPGGAVLVTQTGFDATWGAVGGADGYLLDVSTSSIFTTYVGSYSSLNVGAATSFSVTGLTAGTTYYYRVRAYDASGVSQNSTTSALVTLSVTPGVPVIGTATGISQTAFTAVWGAAVRAAGYQLDVAIDSNFTTMVNGYAGRDVANVTSIAVTGLTSNTTYFYRVRAYNSGGVTLNSNSGVAITLLDIPAIPVAVGADSVGASGFNATWLAAANATGYRLDVSSSAGFGTFVTGYNNKDVGNVTNADVGGLTAGTTYYFRVRGYNAGGTSASSIICALVALAPVAGRPIAETATAVTQNGFTAVWNAVAGATGYELDVATDQLFTNLLPGFASLPLATITSYDVTTLNPGTTYYYRIRGTTGGVIGPDSNIIAVVTLPATSSVPTVTAATSVTQTGFTANWNAASAAVGYYLDVAADSAFTTMISGYINRPVGSVTAAPVNGLTPATPYYYRVRSFNNGGISVSSNNGAVVTLPIIPAAPVLSGALSVSQTSFTATWQSVTGATGYRLDVSTSSGFTSFVTGYSNLDVNNITSSTVISLTAGTTYYYRARAYNAGGSGASSVTGAVMTLPATPAIPATAAATSSTLTSFTANWKAAAGATGYLLDVSTDPAFGSFVPGYSNLNVGLVISQIVSGLVDGTVYHYRVRSYNNGGISANSGTTSTATLPLPPVAVSASTIAQTSFTAGWNVVSGATGYRLDVATDPSFTTISILSVYRDKAVTGGSTTTASVSGLTAGIVYYYRVRAVTAGGSGDNSNVISLMTLGTPLATAASNVTQTSFTANWNTAVGAVDYWLDVSTSSGFGTFMIKDLAMGSAITYDVSGLSPASMYYYRVRAKNGMSVSAYSNTISQSTLATPVAIAATAVTQTGFTANWNPAAGASGYYLDVAADSSFTSILGGYNNLDVGTVLAVNNVVSFPVVGLQPGVTYFYRVRAFTSTATSVSSNSISQITLATPVATAASAISQTGFSASWGKVSGATDYFFDVASDAAFTNILSSYADKKVTAPLTATVTTVVTGLTAGTNYYYRVRSYNKIITSSNSNTIPLVTIPPAPDVTSATVVTQTGFTVNWTAAQSATGYRLEIAANATFTPPLTIPNNGDVGNFTSFSINGLSVGVTYFYRLRAYNISGTSGYSTVVSQSTLTTPVAKPASIITQTSFNANWNAAAGAIGYRLDVASDSLFQNILGAYDNRDVGNVGSAPVSGLLPGVIYYYRLRAYTDVATTGNSDVISQITLATPLATAATSVTQISFKATWNSVVGATGYRLDVANDAAFADILSNYNNKDVGSVTSYAVTGLTIGGSYFYRVRAYNVSATTVNSNVINPTTFPAVPAGTAATAISQTGFTANWNLAIGATGYRLDVAPNSTFSSFVDGYNDLEVNNVLSYPVSGLAAGTTYYYRIRAYNIGGASVSSTPVISLTTVPPAPLATTAAAVTPSGFKASWNAATGASGYLLDLALDSAFTNIVTGYSGKIVTGATTTSLTLTGLEAGTSYYYRVRSTNSGGISENSNVISQATMSIPIATPATLVTQTGFTATWLVVDGASTYQLDVSVKSDFSSYVAGFNNKDVGNVLSYNVTGLISAGVYYYRVRAVNVGVTSINSNVITQGTLGLPVAIAAASITQIGFTARWNPATAAIGYRLDVATDAAFTTMIANHINLDVGNVTSFAVQNIPSGTTYFYRVRAVSSGATSSNSNSITLATLPPTPPVPITASATSVTQYAFNANWFASAGATGYRLDLSMDPTFGSFVPGFDNRDVGSVVSYSLNSLAAGTAYFYRVRAYNSGGTSVSSVSVSQITLPATPPEAPLAVAAASVTPIGFTAGWSSVIGANGYVLDVALDSAFAGMVSDFTNRDVGNVTVMTVAGLTSGTVYYYRVRAYNKAGTSPLSNTITATVKPAAPLAAPLTGITTTGFTFSWSAVTGATGYLVDVSTDAGFNMILTPYYGKDMGAARTVSVTGLAAGTTYYCRVRAYNVSGAGPDSGTVATSSLPTVVVAMPANSITKTEFNAAWGIVGGAVGYRLDVAIDGAFTKFVSGFENLDTGNVTTAVVSGLTAGTTYYYRLRAYSAGGSGVNSNVIVQATLPAPPPAAIAAAPAVIAPSGFTAVWGAVYGASGYRIDVSMLPDFTSFVVGYSNFDVGNTTSYDVIGLTPGTSYYYRVRVYNSGGSGDDSNVVLVACTAAPLTVAISGDGGGSVNSNPSGIACTSGATGSCSAAYDGAISVTLAATPDSYSVFAGWSGACSGMSGCVVPMDSAKYVIATFVLIKPVRIFDLVLPRYFDTLQEAYTVANDGEIIQLTDGIRAGGLVANRSVGVHIVGGFDASYSANTRDTVLQGIVRVQQGSVRMEKIKVGM
jgi:titin